jgi:hypothetical protein
MHVRFGGIPAPTAIRCVRNILEGIKTVLPESNMPPPIAPLIDLTVPEVE